MSATAGLVALCPGLRRVFDAHGYTVAGLEELLDDGGLAALDRSDAAALRRRAAGPRGLLLRLFVLGDRVDRAEVTELLGDELVTKGLAAGLFVSADPDATESAAGASPSVSAPAASAPTAPASAPSTIRADLDLRPVDTGAGCRWVFSDTDGSMVRTTTRPDHVLGVGQASLSLLTITPTTPVGSVLDLGTGCGIQLVHALDSAATGVGTDITPRCLDLAAATLAINGLDAELLTGPWYEPVAGRTFDRIVANPPFVVGTELVGHSYRETGLDLDGASEAVISGAPDHLAPGGTAVLLASWVHVAGESWRSRVASWIPAEGVDAWVLQRDVASPELHVWTWLTDEGLDPRDPDYHDQADAWLDHLAARGVDGIGFGYVYLRRTDAESTVLCEDLPHPFDSGLGADANEYFRAVAWLRDLEDRGDDLADEVFAVSPGVHIHESTLLTTPVEFDDGAPAPPLIVAERTTGARWRHDIDPFVAALLRGMQSGALPLADLVALAELGMGAGGDASAELLDAARSIVVDLLRHGFVRPASW